MVLNLEVVNVKQTEILKMNSYFFEEEKVIVTTYTVDANNEEEAWDKANKQITRDEQVKEYETTNLITKLYD